MTDDESNTDRPERLSERRKDRRARKGSSGVEDESATAGDDTGGDTQQPSQLPLSERNHSTFYLREDLEARLRQSRRHTEGEVDVEYGIELQKNRHIRPLMLYLGAKKLEEMDGTEIAEVLDTTDVLDSIGVSDSTDSDET